MDLSDITLAHILDDALYFLIQNTKYNENPASDISDVDIFFNLTSNVVSLENSYITWYPIFTALQYMSTIFQFPGSANIKVNITILSYKKIKLKIETELTLSKRKSQWNSLILYNVEVTFFFAFVWI